MIAHLGGSRFLIFLVLTDRTPMAQIRCGSGSLHSNLRDEKVSTCFAASSKLNSISVWQKNDGSTTWRLNDDPDEEECLTILTTAFGAYIRVNTAFVVIPFRNAEDFMGNYERYSIDRVEISMYTGSTWSAEASSAGTQVLEAASPLFIYAVDRRNSNPDNMEALLVQDDNGMKQCAVNDPLQVSYRPSANTLIDAAAGVGFSPEYSPIMNTYSNNVDHFGFKVCCYGLQTTPESELPIACVSFIVKQYMSFYGKRPTPLPTVVR